ncbi:hypothetical protein NPIL_120991 [Nephila pilipes]|uniref:Uncharacterized protein n=1 Tax=Nephila pilipes TaxID=299642 RepID=A0A8X6NX26_NEPPI|nr:hypothetical protein NPIL_120991 [Nephila pilipes]
MLTECYEQWMKIFGTKNENQSEIVTATPEEPEIIWNDGYCAAINDGGNSASGNAMNEEALGKLTDVKEMRAA